MKLDSIKHIGIIGTGMIGASLAVLFTGNGYKTTMLAISDEESTAGLERYDTYFTDLIEKGLVTSKQVESCKKLVNVTQTYEDISDVDFIFECVIEKIEVKYAVYTEVEKFCKQFKAIASSTSAISTDDLAKGIKQKDKLMVAHPWNPPHLVPCVEVVKSQFTSNEAVKILTDILESVGREVVMMKKGAPGFIGNRLQHALVREAINMIEQGISTAQDIDRTLRTSFVPRYTSIGLFEHQDYAGLDMVLAIEDYLFPSLSNANKAQDLLRKHVEAGELGYKTGKGLLDWSEVDIKAFRQRASEPYLRFFNWSLPED